MVQTNGPITISGGVATVHFTVANGCQNVQLSLVSYKAPSATFSEQTADQQVKFDSQTQTVSSGSGVLTVAVPACYYQIDFVYGMPIDHLGPAGTNNFYGRQGRLISSTNGGTTACTTTTPTSGGGTPPTPPTPVQPTAPPASTPSTPAAPVVSIVVQKFERVGASGSFVAGPVTATVGQTIQYQINVVNTGNVMVWATVTDALCDTGTLSTPNGQGIGPTSTATFTCSHVVKASEVGTLTNVANATGVAGNGVSATGTAAAVAQVAAASAVGGVAGATHTVVSPAKKPAKKTAKKPAAKKPVKHKAAVKAAQHTKKVTKKAKAAHAVVRAAHFTG
jgi:uncharacterized repeat protein (TIGR01451 family)